MKYKPATQAVRKQAMLPAIIARTTIFVNALVLLGAKFCITAKEQPIDATLENPHRA